MPDFLTWTVEVWRRYKANITPLKGKAKFERMAVERKIGFGTTLMGLLLDAPKTLRIIADYAEIVRLFENCETKDYINRAIERANRETLAYRRRMLRQVSTQL